VCSRVTITVWRCCADCVAVHVWLDYADTHAQIAGRPPVSPKHSVCETDSIRTVIYTSLGVIVFLMMNCLHWITMNLEILTYPVCSVSRICWCQLSECTIVAVNLIYKIVSFSYGTIYLSVQWLNLIAWFLIPKNPWWLHIVPQVRPRGGVVGLHLLLLLQRQCFLVWMCYLFIQIQIFKYLYYY